MTRTRRFTRALSYILVCWAPSSRADAALVDAQNESSAAVSVDAPEAVEPPLPGTLRTLTIEGLEHTTKHVVRRELQWSEGQPIDERAWTLGLTRLWNTVLFARINARRVAVEPGLFDVVLTVDESFTLYPSFTGVVTSDVRWFRTGIAETNVAGTFHELSVHYEQFNDARGGSVFFRNQRLFDERLELSIFTGRVARPRPTFTLIRSLARVEVAQLFNEDRLRVGVRFETGFDDYTRAIDGTQQPQPADAYGTMAAPVRMGRLDRVRVEYEGEFVDVTPSATYTGGPSKLFSALSVDARMFRRWPGRINLALRAIGAATGASSDNFRLYIGGLETVRGYPDSYANGVAYAAANAELRWSAINWSHFVMMPTVFADAAVVGGERVGRDRLLSVGAGVRFLIPSFAAAGIRIDVAQPLIDGSGPALSVGAYQFFF